MFWLLIKKQKSFICFGYLLLVWNIFCYIISNSLNEHIAKGESEVFSNSFILLSGCHSLFGKSRGTGTGMRQNIIFEVG
jgi:hypothetical protein